MVLCPFEAPNATLPLTFACLLLVRPAGPQQPPKGSAATHNTTPRPLFTNSDTRHRTPYPSRTTRSLRVDPNLSAQCSSAVIPRPEAVSKHSFNTSPLTCFCVRACLASRPAGTIPLSEACLGGPLFRTERPPWVAVPFRRSPDDILRDSKQPLNPKSQRAR